MRSRTELLVTQAKVPFVIKVGTMMRQMISLHASEDPVVMILSIVGGRIQHQHRYSEHISYANCVDFAPLTEGDLTNGEG